jgi:hypothetical protein
MSTLKVNAIGDAGGSGPVATLPTSGGSNFTLGPNWGVWEFASITSISAAANINVTSLAAVGDYLLILENFDVATDSCDLYFRISDDGGSNYEADASDYDYTVDQHNTGTNSTGAAQIQMNVPGRGIGNDTGNSGYMEVTLVNPGGTGFFHQVLFRGYTASEASTPIMEVVSGAGRSIGGTAAINAAQFLLSSGNFIAQGSVLVYRRRRS